MLLGRRHVVDSYGCVGIGYVAVSRRDRAPGAIYPFLEWALIRERKDMSRHVPFVLQLLDPTTRCTGSPGAPMSWLGPLPAREKWESHN